MTTALISHSNGRFGRRPERLAAAKAYALLLERIEVAGRT